jgi:hypothetical protein
MSSASRPDPKNGDSLVRILDDRLALDVKACIQDHRDTAAFCKLDQ